MGTQRTKSILMFHPLFFLGEFAVLYFFSSFHVHLVQCSACLWGEVDGEAVVAYHGGDSSYHYGVQSFLECAVRVSGHQVSLSTVITFHVYSYSGGLFISYHPYFITAVHKNEDIYIYKYIIGCMTDAKNNTKPMNEEPMDYWNDGYGESSMGYEPTLTRST